MNFIRNILVVILFIQLLIFLYVKLIHENITQHTSKQTISKYLASKKAVKKLPISSQYTEWDEKKVTNLNKKIEKFNQQLKNKLPNKPDSEKTATPPKKIIKIAKKLKPTPTISIRTKIAKYAKAKLGKKYVWGATGPLSFDCSGFTREVYKFTTGIKIPRVSRDQAKVGKYVKYAGLKPGDMVFFDTEKKYSGKVNHVGIYLNNGNFIHASSAKKKVIITNFKKKPFYKKRFLWGRRVVNKQS